MGLDMYLEGRKGDYSRERKLEDGFPVKEKILELGYWRKHPNLHGFIVREFAGGKDECQEIPLSLDALKKILRATLEDQLPHTEGFFFGTSMPEDKEATIEIVTKAIDWLASEREDLEDFRSVIYQASW